MESQTLLKAALRQRHWQTYHTFIGEYDRAAETIDPRLVGHGPSRAQFHRWLAGDLRRLPHTDHCRVLENMFPNWSAEQLFRPSSETATHPPASVALAGQFEGEFSLTTPMTPNENPQIVPYTLSNPARDGLVYLNWETFGLGIERLIRQIKNIGRRLDVDACFGINEAGLVMATFLASAVFNRCAVGYLKCNKTGSGIALSEDSYFPDARTSPTFVICDFEVKRADVVGFIVDELRSRYPDVELYFTVFGAMTDEEDPRVQSFDRLTGASIMEKAGFAGVFIATTMHPPGIEPPLELR